MRQTKPYQIRKRLGAGTNETYSQEEKLQIGKFGLIHGASAASRYFSSLWQKRVPRTTVHGFMKFVSATSLGVCSSVSVTTNFNGWFIIVSASVVNVSLYLSVNILSVIGSSSIFMECCFTCKLVMCQNFNYDTYLYTCAGVSVLTMYRSVSFDAGFNVSMKVNDSWLQQVL